jgi:phosphotransferase system  glucose/maltose/N-acetylglucosamine-specific IIC component
MAAITFDTPAFVKTLEASGMPTPQAEAVAIAVRNSTESADLVTRKDLQIELAPIKAELTTLRHEIEARFIQLEQRMTIKLGAMMVAIMGAGVAMFRMLGPS